MASYPGRRLAKGAIGDNLKAMEVDDARAYLIAEELIEEHGDVAAFLQVAGLFGEGRWDVIAWLGLATPFAAIAWGRWRSR